MYHTYEVHPRPQGDYAVRTIVSIAGKSELHVLVTYAHYHVAREIADALNANAVCEVG